MAARKHVGLIEWKMRHPKEKVRATTSEFPFMWIPILILIQMIYSCAFWIHASPNHSENFGFSPREIVTGLSTDYERDCKVDIGSYLEASTDAIVMNDNTKRTRSLPLGLLVTGRAQFDIESGKILHRRTVTQLPWPIDSRLVKKAEAGVRRGKA